MQFAVAERRRSWLRPESQRLLERRRLSHAKRIRRGAKRERRQNNHATAKQRRRHQPCGAASSLVKPHRARCARLNAAWLQRKRARLRPRQRRRLVAGTEWPPELAPPSWALRQPCGRDRRASGEGRRCARWHALRWRLARVRKDPPLLAQPRTTPRCCTPRLCSCPRRCAAAGAVAAARVDARTDAQTLTHAPASA